MTTLIAAPVVSSPVHEVSSGVTAIPGMAVDPGFFQQGDVLLERVTDDAWPKADGNYRTLRLKEDRRLAVSATTGYSHEASTGRVYEELSYGGRPVEGTLWLDAPAGCEIRHPEHGTIQLAPDRYRVFGVVEFDPFEAPGSQFAVRRGGG